jgi:tetratricopeptide (TPR) repeat protein/DNA-binding SARP family transcriptional activator
MEFRTLGPIQLWSAGHRQDLGSAREQSLLVMLLVTPRAIVPAETLIDQLWDKRPPPKARESLSAYIARLRASLRRAVGDKVQLVRRTQGGYLLDVDPELVDVHRFRRLRRQAAALAASGVYEHAAGLLHEADELWRGPALAGIRGEWARRMRDALEEERRGAIIERIGCELELGRHADLVGELGHLLAKYPLDETLVAHQMTALYRNGRQADALGTYRETRSRLIEEQGAEPGTMLSELHQRMLARDPGLASKAARRYAVPAPAPDTLPAETPDFVGRDKELRLLAGEHGSEPWVAVIEGMPGVGKTALAVRAARLAAGHYPDGTLFLNLHSHDPGNPTLDPAEALHHLLRMASVPAAQIPASIGERTALWRAHLSRRRAVVILDDAAGYDQIRLLLPVTGRCLTLITTRRRLPDVVGAHHLTLDVLSLDEAVTLFRWIAGQSRAMDEDQVAATVGLCGRLPLAIQLTAGRIAQAGPPGLDDLIEEWPSPASPAWLGGTGAASPEVIAAFELSYRALAPGQQRIFRRLSLSPCATHSPRAMAALGGCTLGEAEQALGTLLDCHLLTPVPAGQFRLHDLIRGYAHGCALRDDSEVERQQAVSRLLDCYLHMADRADRILHPFRRRQTLPGPDLVPDVPALATQDDAARWLESEWRNILQAASYAGRHEWKQACADLSDVLAEFLEISAYWDEAIAAHTAALQASRYLADPARTAHALLALGVVRQQTGRHDAAIPLAEEAAAICRTLGDLRGEGESLVEIGLAHQRTARSREALAYFREARVLYEEAADLRGVANTLMYSGIACWHLGRRPEADSNLRDALARYREVGDRRGEGKALNNLGKVHLHSGRHGDALDAYQQALQIFREIGGPQHEAILCQSIGSVHRHKGSYEEALSAYRRALAIYRNIGDLPDEADALNDIGAIYQSAGRYDEALIHHEKARLIADDVGDASQQLIARRLIADTHRGSGRNGEALEHYQSALKLAREIGDLYEEGKALEGIAELTLYTERRDAARIVFRQALDIFERLGVPEAESVRTRIRAIDPGRVHDPAVNERA